MAAETDRFATDTDVPILDLEKVRQALGTLYLLSSSESGEAMTESYWVEEMQQYRRFVIDDDATLKCFCPTILFDHLLNPPVDDLDEDYVEEEFGSMARLSRQNSNPHRELSFRMDPSFNNANNEELLFCDFS